MANQKPDFQIEPNSLSNIKKVIGVVSSKGGVGKSLVTSILAVEMNRRGYRTAILDADITGPSIPTGFGLREKAVGVEQGILPIKSKTDISIMSVNFLLENETDPVVWRSPLITGAIRQFWSDVIWGDIDYMFVDMPPGTGDVPLTVFQSLPVDGIVVVTSPQQLVATIVAKAVKMAELMNIPIVGIVENMAYVQCPDCSREIKVYGESHISEVAGQYNVDVLARIPIDPKIASAVDSGSIEDLDIQWLDELVKRVENV